MKIIEQKMIEAIKGGKNFKCKNTEVISSANFSDVILSGVFIARVDRKAFGFSAMFLVCGRLSQVMKSRLNAVFSLLGKYNTRVTILTHKGVPFLQINYPDRCISTPLNYSGCYRIFSVPADSNIGIHLQVDKIPLYEMYAEEERANERLK